ncbi:MAG: sodium:proton antiporter, partial [Sphingobacteriales bacterium]
AKAGTDTIMFSSALLIFVQEVFGGIVLGALSGYIAFRLMRSIIDFQTIVLVSLALVMADSVIASLLHLSIPIAVVTAGLFAGSRSIDASSKEHSHQALEKFWELIDEMLNTVLFSMIGLQMVNFPFIDSYWRTGCIAIVVLLIARWLSIVLPLTFLRRTLKINYGSVNVLTWAGVRGGISIALALSLQIEARYKYLIVCATFFVVIFSIIFQGLTLKHLINYLYRKEEK